MINRASTLIAAIAIAIFSTSASAGVLDPWYLVYRVEGGVIQKVAGPFRMEAECQLARHFLPYGTEFIGCFQ